MVHDIQPIRLQLPVVLFRDSLFTPPYHRASTQVERSSVLLVLVGACSERAYTWYQFYRGHSLPCNLKWSLLKLTCGNLLASFETPDSCESGTFSKEACKYCKCIICTSFTRARLHSTPFLLSYTSRCHFVESAALEGHFVRRRLVGAQDHCYWVVCSTPNWNSDNLFSSSFNQLHLLPWATIWYSKMILFFLKQDHLAVTDGCLKWLFKNV